MALPGCPTCHTDPLICPQCQHPMRVIAVIDQRAVVEKILRHLGLWSGTPPLAPARAPPDANVGPWIREPCDDVDPMPACRAGRRRSTAQAGPTTKTSSPTEDECPPQMSFSVGPAADAPMGCAPQGAGRTGVPLPDSANKTPKNVLDAHSHQQKVVEDEPDAKAILPEPRSVKKQIPIISLF